MFVISVVFTLGVYFNKVNNIEYLVAQHAKTIADLDNKSSVLIALLQEKYPNINVYAYINAAIMKNTSPDKIALGLEVLKNKNRKTGVQYLLQDQKFNSEEVTSIFDFPEKKIETKGRNDNGK